MKRYRPLFIISMLAIAAGLFGLLPLAYFNWQSQQAVTQATTVAAAPALPPAPNLVSGKPVHMQVPATNIDLEVIDGTFNPRNATWTLTNTKAQYAVPSTPINNLTGNTLIYGHDIPAVFERLEKLQPGDTAVITTDNGYTFTFVYTSTEALNPKDLSVFSYDGPSRLTLQTCSGAWSQHRQMYYFRFDHLAKN